MISRDLKNSNSKFPMYFKMFQDIHVRCQGFFTFTCCHSALIKYFFLILTLFQGVFSSIFWSTTVISLGVFGLNHCLQIQEISASDAGAFLWHTCICNLISGERDILGVYQTPAPFFLLCWCYGRLISVFYIFLVQDMT